MSQPLQTITELSERIRALLEGDEGLQNVWVQAELGNFTRHSSGHLYFSLKDEQSTLSAVMFKGNHAAAGSPVLQAGIKVKALGDITVYLPRGQYQMLVKRIIPLGVGDLHQQMLALKARLEAEGIIDERRRRPIPKMPRCIAVVTSPTGAVVQDIIQTLKRRFPHLRVLVVPAVVQGTAAPASLLGALALTQQLEGVEVILLARGGGSAEDLACFNDEALARAIAASSVPVISAIGHQTDYTLADYVADLRAPTPTAAAELVSAEGALLQASLQKSSRELLSYAEHRWAHERQRLDHLNDRMAALADRLMVAERNRLTQMEQQLRTLDHRQMLSLGYTLSLQNDSIVCRRADLDPSLPLTTLWDDGEVRSSIMNT